MLPEGLVGKGLGSRAFLHALKSGFVMHDSSYSCPVELRGSTQVLQQLLEPVRCHISFNPESHQNLDYEYSYCSMVLTLGESVDVSICILYTIVEYNIMQYIMI